MRITDFPLFLATVSRGSLPKVENAVQVLGEAVEAGEIANVTYENEVKFFLGRAFDDAWDEAVQKPFQFNREYRNSEAEDKIFYSLNGHPMPHTVQTFINRIEKAKLDTDFTRTALALLAELKVMGDAIVSLKKEGKVVKRQPKAPEDLKAKYNAPEASSRAIGQVRDILIEITDKAYQGLVSYYKDEYAKGLALFVERTNALYAKRPESRTPLLSEDERKAFQAAEQHANDALPFLSFFDAIEKIDEDYNYSAQVRFRKLALKGNAQEVTDAQAIVTAERIRDGFVYKNLVKLDSILEAKGDFAKIEIVGYELSLGSLEGTLRLTFKDGAAFTVVNKIVDVRNSYGTAFERFPLTFHDVVMGDGSKMGRPSEERMNTVFVGKAA
jgi:hypothetical protein